MEHIVITHLHDGYLRLLPEQGYVLYSTALRRTFSEAIVKEGQEKNFMAVETN